MKRAVRLRAVCLTMAAVCCLLAVISIGSVSAPFLHPVVSSWRVTCVYVACDRSDVVQAPLSEPARVSDQSGEVERLRARAVRPRVRIALAFGELVRIVPEVAFLLSLAVGLRRLAKGEVFERSTVRWFRRAAAAALWSVLADVAALYIQTTTLTGLAGDFTLELGGGAVDGFVFASVAWVVAWALEEGVRTRSELAEYV